MTARATTPAAARRPQPLDADQLRAACWTPADGNLRILAGAGAGKTRALAALAAGLLAPTGTTTVDGVPGRGIDPGRIVVVTFARKAAQELRERVAARVSAYAAEALTLGTYHALAARALRFEAWRWAHGRNLDGAEREDGVPSAMQLWRAALWAKPLPTSWMRGQAAGTAVPVGFGSTVDPARYMQAVDLLRSYGSWHTGAAAGAVQLPHFKAAWALVEGLKRANQWWDYADLLSRWRWALREEARLEGVDPLGRGAAEDGGEGGGSGTARGGGPCDGGARSPIRKLPAPPPTAAPASALHEAPGEDPTVEAGARARRHALRGGRIVLVDEGQDNSRVQLDIARLLARGPEGRVVMVGDLRQSVHRWRGADPSLFLLADRELAARTVALRTNYRSGRSIVAFGNATQAALVGYGRGERPPVSGLPGGRAPAVVWGPDAHEAVQASRAASGRVTLRRWGIAADEAADAVFHEIRARLHGTADGAVGPDADDAVRGVVPDGTPPGSIAVLCRTNAALAAFEQAAIRAGVPVELVGAAPFWTQPIPLAVLGYARLIEADYASALVDVWNQPRRFLQRALADRAAELVRSGRASSFVAALRVLVQEARGSQATGLHGLARTLDDLRTAGWPAGLDIVARTLSPAAQGEDRLLRHATASDGTADDHAAVLSAALAEARRHPSPRELLRHARGCLQAASLRDASGSAAGRSVGVSPAALPPVTLSTIHRFKGREAPIIYYWAPKGQAPRGGSRDEEACLFYVAVTRARDELHVGWADYDIQGETPTGPGGFVRLPGIWRWRRPDGTWDDAGAAAPVSPVVSVHPAHPAPAHPSPLAAVPASG